jgi:hypothetical protein
MRLDTRSFAVAFLVGLLGWLLVGYRHLTGELVFFAALLVGAIAGALTRRPVAIGGLVAGILAAYPIALAIGLIVFLGENWLIYAVMASALATVGFFLSILAGARSRSVSATDAALDVPSPGAGSR